MMYQPGTKLSKHPLDGKSLFSEGLGWAREIWQLLLIRGEKKVFSTNFMTRSAVKLDGLILPKELDTDGVI